MLRRYPVSLAVFCFWPLSATPSVGEHTGGSVSGQVGHRLGIGKTWMLTPFCGEEK
jgi:hypothetical protein